MKIFIKLFLLAVIFSPALVSAQGNQNNVDWGVHPIDFSTVGTAGWQFLKLPTNARSAAIAGIRSPLSSGDANAAFNNPASLSDIENISVSFNYMNWVADIGYNAVSAAKSFGDWGVVGLHMIYVDYGQEPRTEYLEQQLISGVVYSPALDGLGTVGANDMAIGLSYSRQITDKLQVGGNIRYLEERIDDAKTSTWSIDVGTMFYTGYKTLRVSMLGTNFGPDAEFREYANRIQKVPFRVKMPMQLSLGVAMDVLEQNVADDHFLMVAMDYIVPNDGEKKVNIGAEYSFMNLFTLRAGYKFNYDEESLTFGGGVNYELSDYNISVNYAFLNTGLFGSVNMFSLGLEL